MFRLNFAHNRFLLVDPLMLLKINLIYIHFLDLQGAQDEIWALASHPTSGKYLTGSHDGTVIERDVDNKKILWSEKYSVSLTNSSCFQ